MAQVDVSPAYLPLQQKDTFFIFSTGLYIHMTVAQKLLITVDIPKKNKNGSVQEGGVEPPTSAVLRPRHNQLDHPCFADQWDSSNY
jgi:hypothetical protein